MYRRYLVFDTETVGLKNKKMLEIAGAFLESETSSKNSFSLLLRKKPFSFFFSDLLNFLGTEPVVLVAHNIRFDMEVLEHNLSREEYQFLKSKISKEVCSLSIVRQMKENEFPFLPQMERTPTNKPSKTLTNVYIGLFGRKFPNAHTAVGDVKALVEILSHQNVRKYL